MWIYWIIKLWMNKIRYVGRVVVECPSSCARIGRSERRVWTLCTDSDQSHCTADSCCRPHYSCMAHSLSQNTPHTRHHQLHSTIIYFKAPALDLTLTVSGSPTQNLKSGSKTGIVSLDTAKRTKQILSAERSDLSCSIRTAFTDLRLVFVSVSSFIFFWLHVLD